MHRLSLKALPLFAALCVAAIAGASTAGRGARTPAPPVAAQEKRVPIRFTGTHTQHLVLPFYCIDGTATMVVEENGDFVIDAGRSRKIEGKVTSRKIIQTATGMNKEVTHSELVIYGPERETVLSLPLEVYSSEEATGPVSLIKLLNKDGRKHHCFRFCPPDDDFCKKATVKNCAGLAKCLKRQQQTPASEPPASEPPAQPPSR